MKSNLDTGLFISRLDYQAFPIELPPLSRRERERAALNRLRGLYPGKLDDKFIVVRPNGKSGAYLCFVFNSSLRNYSLSVSTLAAAKLCGKGRRYCVIAWDGWVEYLVLEEGRILSSTVTNKEGRLVDQLSARAAEWFDVTEPPGTNPPDERLKDDNAVLAIEVFCATADCPSRTAIETGKLSINFTALEKALVHLSRAAWSCFPERLPQVKRRRLLFAMTICAIAVMSGLHIRNWYGQREAENVARREAERRIALETAELKGREERLAVLKDYWEAHLAEQRVGVYAAMETLASCLSPAIRLVSSAVNESGSFRLEGSATNAIAALEDLQSHPETKDVVIGTIVWDGGLERFTVSGTVERHLSSPREDMPDNEKIGWYETALIKLEGNVAMPETAAAAAQLVRELLERNHLGITRFRYLDAEEGWAIECSTSGTAMQVVQVLREANEAGALRITNAETRTRQNGLDAVLTFYIPGPGNEYRLREYEENPPVASIASLYGIFPERAPVPQPVRIEQPEEIVQPEIAPPTITPPSPPLSNLLEYVGYIGTVEGSYIYAKDIRSGELYRLAEGEGAYSYRIDGSGRIIALLGEAFGPTEVRRNDGF